MSHSHPIIAAIYDRFLASDEKAFLADLRARLVGEARGTVVEIGAGTGVNFAHYRSPQVRAVHAVEPDPHMRRRARPRAAESAVPVDFCDASGEALPFPAGFADTVVATLVLCSVDDPGHTIAEIRRVLKADGTLVYIEHVRSDRGGWRLLQELATPLWRRVAANCHANRLTLQSLAAGGFEVAVLARLDHRGPWGNPVVAGIARQHGKAPDPLSSAT